MGHFYDKDGNPCHFVEGKNGEQRDSTLRDARKHGWYPSVTGILGILDKPALTNWKLKRVTEACYNDLCEYIDNENIIPSDDYSVYHDEIMGMAFKESTNARDRGSEIHNCLEAIAGGLPRTFPSDIQEIGDAAFSAIVEHCETSRFTAEATVVGDGYGGMLDLHNDEFVLDHKTKDIKDAHWAQYKAGKRLYPAIAYPDNCQQLIAYDKALPPVSINRRLVNVFIDRQIPGRVIIHEWTPEEAEKGWKVFQNALEIWQITKDYYPGNDFNAASGGAE